MVLSKGDIRSRKRDSTKRPVLAITNDTHDLPPRPLLAVEPHALANRVLATEMHLDDCLVEHHNRRRAVDIVITEVTASHQRNAESLEKPRPDHVGIGTVRGVASLNHEAERATPAT